MKNLLIALCLALASFNLGLALEEYSPPSPAEEFEADFYNSILGKEEKAKIRPILPRLPSPSPLEIAYKDYIYTPSSATKKLAELMLEEKEQRLEEKEQPIQYLR